MNNFIKGTLLVAGIAAVGTGGYFGYKGITDKNKEITQLKTELTQTQEENQKSKEEITSLTESNTKLEQNNASLEKKFESITNTINNASITYVDDCASFMSFKTKNSSVNIDLLYRNNVFYQDDFSGIEYVSYCLSDYISSFVEINTFEYKDYAGTDAENFYYWEKGIKCKGIEVNEMYEVILSFENSGSYSIQSITKNYIPLATGTIANLVLKLNDTTLDISSLMKENVTQDEVMNFLTSNGCTENTFIMPKLTFEYETNEAGEITNLTYTMNLTTRN